MMPSGIFLKQAPVQHMRKPGKRLPVIEFKRTECPLNTFEIKSCLNITVLGNVLIIIKINESISQNPDISGKGGKD